MWDEDAYVDHCAAFGAASSNGVFGRPADAIVSIYRFRGVQDLIKWVDDYVFFRYPIQQNPDGSYVYSYDESLIFSVAERLGWPWSLPKHSPFADVFTYNGFQWCLSARTVEIAGKKKAKYLARLAPWVVGASVTKKEVEGAIGMLNHCCLAVPEGRSRLPSLYRMNAAFTISGNQFSRHKITNAALEDVAWWQGKLAEDFCGQTLFLPPLDESLDIFVDASTSWGIGLIVGGKWCAWKLAEGWKSDGQDIGWAEMVAVELAVRHLVAIGAMGVMHLIRSDNKGVIGALDAGRSHSIQQNRILREIVSIFNLHRIWAKTLYVNTKDNLADPPSRGIFPDMADRLEYTFRIPSHLEPFVQYVT
ncbi:hypothetical protein EVJ58_g2059 [Rhodofomes roseus]|uniref:Uncharacterized protein n=1 Tax=Rhodofomes roseus TaxID=34475 RepID=A0A4Y9YUA0_9APHY|nr:hypothetical protein EVJ58_g2059 [Rhodofomes roseus]